MTYARDEFFFIMFKTSVVCSDIKESSGCFAHTANDLSGSSNSLPALLCEIDRLTNWESAKNIRKINLLLLNYFPHTAAHELKKESFLLISAIIERINIH